MADVSNCFSLLARTVLQKDHLNFMLVQCQKYTISYRSLDLGYPCLGLAAALRADVESGRSPDIPISRLSILPSSISEKFPQYHSVSKYYEVRLSKGKLALGGPIGSSE